MLPLSEEPKASQAIEQEEIGVEIREIMHRIHKSKLSPAMSTDFPVLGSRQTRGILIEAEEFEKVDQEKNPSW